jgi:hypothetical protein
MKKCVSDGFHETRLTCVLLLFMVECECVFDDVPSNYHYPPKPFHKGIATVRAGVVQ